MSSRSGVRRITGVNDRVFLNRTEARRATPGIGHHGCSTGNTRPVQDNRLVATGSCRSSRCCDRSGIDGHRGLCRIRTAEVVGHGHRVGVYA